MNIIKIKERVSPFAIIDKGILNNKNLSFKAKGLAAYFLSLPANWSINVVHLMKVGKDKRESIENAIQELITEGYLVKEPNQRNAGRFTGYTYEFNETPNRCGKPATEENNSTVAGFTVADKPQRVSRSGKPATSNNISTNNIDSNIDFTNKDYISEKSDLENFLDDLPEAPELEAPEPEPANLKSPSGKSKKKKKVAPKKKKGAAPLLFADTDYAQDKDLFLSKFNGPDYENIDLGYYYEAVKDWSAANSTTKNDWIATARTFMRKDKAANKLQLNITHEHQQEHTNNKPGKFAGFGRAAKFATGITANK